MYQCLLVALKLAMNFAPFLAKTLKLAMNFAPFLAKNSHLSIGEEFCNFPCQKVAPQFLSSWRTLSSHFPLPKTLRSSKQFAFFVLLLSNGVTGDRSTETNDRISGCTVPLLIEKMNQIKARGWWPRNRSSTKIFFWRFVFLWVTLALLNPIESFPWRGCVVQATKNKEESCSFLDASCGPLSGLAKNRHVEKPKLRLKRIETAGR